MNQPTSPTDTQGASHAFTGPVKLIDVDTPFWCRRCRITMGLKHAALFRCVGSRFMGVCKACLQKEP